MADAAATLLATTAAAVAPTVSSVSSLLPATPAPAPAPTTTLSLPPALSLLLRVPIDAYSFFSYTATATITFHYWTIAGLISLLTFAIWVLVRYRLLTRYSRLPVPPVQKHTGAPFDLHPDTALDDKQDLPGNYPDEFLGAFLASIKVFGYLDRPVFHELARHLQTRKLKKGEILQRDAEEERDFYVVVDGVVQVFVRGTDEAGREGADLAPESGRASRGSDEGLETEAELGEHPLGSREMPNHHLLNEVKAGGTVSSLFGILSVFTEDMQLPPNICNLPRSRDAHLSPLSPPAAKGDVAAPRPASADLQPVFPGLRRAGSNSGKSSPEPLEPSEVADGTAEPEKAGSPPSPKSNSRPFHPNIVIRAASDTTLAIIPAEAFQKLTEKFPNAAAHIVQVILTRFQRVTFMTLYRYLGLSKELLKIEKRVNEISGYCLPDGFFLPGGLEHLRSKMNATGDFFATGGAASPSTAGSHHGSRRPSKSNFPTWRVDENYEGDAEDSERESVADRGHSKHPSLVGRQLLSTPGEDDDDHHLKESVFSCISQIIGILHPEPAMHLRASIISPRESMASLDPTTLLENLPPRRKNDLRMSGTPHLHERSRASFDVLVDDSHSDTSNQSVVGGNTGSSSSLFSDPGSSEVQILFFPKGATIVSEGEKIEGIYYVVEGTLEASMRSSVDPDLFTDRDEGGSSGGAGHRGERRYRRSLFLIGPGGLAGYLAALAGHSSFVTIRAKTNVALGFLPKVYLDRYVERNPAILLLLAKRLISQISPLVLHIDVALEWGQVNAGQILCRQGEHSDSIYIVLNGRLRAIVERGGGATTRDEGSGVGPRGGGMGDGGFEILAEYGQGESVGEMEVLTDTRRTATVHAIRDTEVAVMPKTLFNALALRHPEITIAISRIIAARSRRAAGVSASPSFAPTSVTTPGADSGNNNVNLRTVAILPVTSVVPIVEFADRLSEGLGIVGASVALLNTATVMSKLGKHAFSRLGRLKLMSWLADQEERYRLVLYVADGGVNSPWTQRCVRQADCILLVGLGDEDPMIGEYERLLIGMKTTARKELVLLHQERACIPGSTVSWLKNRLWVQMRVSTPKMLSDSSRKNTLSSLRTHFQKYYTPLAPPQTPHSKKQSSPAIHTGVRSDFARLARRLLSRSVGLVLGGGGARGISHIGFIRAFEEAGIPIDMVGGTSIGSFVGGLYARDNDHVSVYGRAKMFSGRVVSVWRQLLDLTYPVTAMFTGHEFNRGIWKCFKDTQIEDCWLSYFAATSGATSAPQCLSPATSPPLCDDGNMLLDGGYLNNLPADIMRTLGARAVIAIDVGRVDDTSPVRYGDSLSGWWVLLQRLNPFRPAKGRIPELADIQSRLAYVSSVKQLEEVQRMEGVVYLHPPVDGFGTLEFDKFGEIFMVGYRAGKEAVKRWERDGTMEKLVGRREAGRVDGGGGRHSRRASI
ncbi:hypothetical protein BDK51DRAFT_35697 [Blyttiomyces helicus]|uniref:Lysophospholipase NTE1 n=1 Tax=Blyttiomyces helicus TaxID=388810 RepID=A0A4P9WJN8_9FUNG|nr:hypothetical protein BDK51DRAFT_35697 [Blyttiomyces helicus]|eukprot:RKO92173.1 hypothetical protein BDK51DRAFT_35697 [Blyttiomyces helicus]